MSREAKVRADPVGGVGRGICRPVGYAADLERIRGAIVNASTRGIRTQIDGVSPRVSRFPMKHAAHIFETVHTSLRSLRTASTLRAIGQMLSTTGRPPRGGNVLSLHDLAEFELRADRPMAFQVDGEYVGERERVCFRSVPDALRILA